MNPRAGRASAPEPSHVPHQSMRTQWPYYSNHLSNNPPIAFLSHVHPTHGICICDTTKERNDAKYISFTAFLFYRGSVRSTRSSPCLPYIWFLHAFVQRDSKHPGAHCNKKSAAATLPLQIFRCEFVHPSHKFRSAFVQAPLLYFAEIRCYFVHEPVSPQEYSCPGGRYIILCRVNFALHSVAIFSVQPQNPAVFVPVYPCRI